ncbi:MAG TPA: hypothetical protein VF374_04725 [Thermoplasmata archaeon]
MTSTGASRKCVSCGRDIAWDANVCPYCGHDYRTVAPQAAQKKESVMPVIGGILIIIAGLIEIGMGGVLIAGGTASSWLPLVGGEIAGILAVCGAILLILGIIALLGGIFAVQRKNFGIAVLGGILGLVAWFIPALIGLILIAVSKDEFK